MPRALILTLLLAALAPSPAEAYVYTRNANGTPIVWRKTNCLYMRIDANGSDDVAGDADIKATRKAWLNWYNATKSCSYITFKELASKKGLKAAYDSEGDNENIITWVESGWTYNRHAVALTKVSFVELKENKGEGDDGRILDADIVFNGQHLRFSATGQAMRHDIENTLTHEMGHVLGFDHNCDDGTYKTPPEDDKGNKIPKCGSSKVTQAMKDATMYFLADEGETKKRSLTGDDVKAVCETYPKPIDPWVCKPTNMKKEYAETGCAVAAGRSAGSRLALVWLLLLVLPLVARRRVEN